MREDENNDVANFLRGVSEGQESIIDVINEVDEEGKAIKRIAFGCRKLQPEPPVEAAVATAKARSHEFNDLSAFAEYLKREANGDGCVVLADVSRRQFLAVLDEHEPTDRETISMAAVEHPLFTPWGQMLDRAVPVLEFALFAMKNRRAVIEPEGRELALTFSQVKASKSITTQVGVGKKSINGMMVELEIAGEKKGVPVELPEVIKVELPLFVDTQPQVIEIDLLVTEGREGIVVFATAADVEEQRILAFEQMVNRLRDETGMLVGLGRVQHRNWETVR